MRILMSAYACEPGRGSESEVGWRWALAAASLGHEVTVLTRANNSEKIAAASAEWCHLPITFQYREAWGPLLRLKRRFRMPRLYYLAWQASLCRFVLDSVRRGRFDRYHHVTYVSARFPSPLALAGRRFVWGPIGGLGRVPKSLRCLLGARGRVIESARGVMALVDRLSPLWWATVCVGRRILVADDDTLAGLPGFVQSKARLCPAVGIDVPDERSIMPAVNRGLIVMIGELTARKGQLLALQALSVVRDYDWQALVIGEGEGVTELQSTVEAQSLTDRVTLTGTLPRSEVQQLLARRPIFVSLSLRDSGGMALLEAAAAGCPLVFLGVGGPRQLMGSVADGMIPPGDPEDVIHATVTVLRRLMDDADYAELAGRDALRVVRTLDWNSKSDALRWLYGDD